MWKISYQIVFFPKTGLPFFLILIWAICQLSASWALFLKQKAAHCVLSLWLICIMLRSYMLMLCNTFEFFQSQTWPVFVCVTTANNGIKSKPPKTAWAHAQLDFPRGYWTWVVKYKANIFGWKITKKVLELSKLMTQIWSNKFRLIYFMI